MRWLLAFMALLATPPAVAQQPPPARTAPAPPPADLTAAEQAASLNPTIVRPSRDPARRANGLAPTPPMGWNSWNRFQCSGLNEQTVRGAADALVASGMRDAGYVYVVIDDCWQAGRDPAGTITADPAKFPSGMATLAAYVHGQGLKFGLYSDAGMKTCGGRPGSQGHEFQDARTYAAWGVDYLKYDWCWTGARNAEEAYALMADALRATGRDIVLSICEWGRNRPWEWAGTIGNLWRTTPDIRNAWSGRRRFLQGVVEIVDDNEPLHPYAGPGHWNDPDMLQVGNGVLTAAESRSHFSLWAIMAAPLMAGNDLAVMDATTRAVLLNREVIAVDQDPLGRQGRRVRDDGDHEVWSRPLADGGRAVVLFNRGSAPAEIAVAWPELDYPATLSLATRDLWAHRSLGRKRGTLTATVPAHDVVMIRLSM